MPAKTGMFIVIEGTDGSGKGTQFELLAQRLATEGYDVAAFDFPRYDEPSSYFVKQYLNGVYGSADEVGPYTASLFYALDRYEAAAGVREALAAGKIVLANRFTASSMGHQGGKFGHAEQRRGFFIWLDNLEFEMLNIPRPDMNFVLRVPADIAQKLVDQKAARSYTDKKRDIHEADIHHLERAVEVYDDLCKLFPKDFSRIDCVRGGELMTIEQIQTQLWERIKPILPEKPKKNLQKTVTASSVADHTATTKIDAPAANAHVDDSTQQPATLQLSVKNASMLLLMQLKLHHQANYIEQPSTHFGQKDSAGNYRYIVPENLQPHIKKQYCKALDTIFDLYAAIVQRLTEHAIATASTPAKDRDRTWETTLQAQVEEAARGVLPLAATTDVNLFVADQAVESLLTDLLSNDLPEAIKTGQDLRAAVNHTVPTDAAVAYQADTRHAMQQLTQELLAENYAAGTEQPATLVDFWPKNELSLAADMLYQHSNLPLEAVQTEVNGWSYDQKATVLKTYLGKHYQHQPGRALEKVHYSWDVVSEWTTFLHFPPQPGNDLAWQACTPRHGYDVPALVEAAGLIEQFEACFDVSLGLYSLLQQEGHDREAQYATLQGHKLRWKVAYNAREAFRLHEAPHASPAYRALIQAMHEQIAEVHPLVAEGMQFTTNT